MLIDIWILVFSFNLILKIFFVNFDQPVKNKQETFEKLFQNVKKQR